jgi:hypothetical protein
MSKDPPPIAGGESAGEDPRPEDLPRAASLNGIVWMEKAQRLASVGEAQTSCHVYLRPSWYMVGVPGHSPIFFVPFPYPAFVLYEMMHLG